MSDQKILTLIAYDIENDRARARIAEILEAVAVRVQKSVFEARLDQTETERLALSLTPHVGQGDSVRFYPVVASGRDRLKVLGRGRPPEDGPFLLF